MRVEIRQRLQQHPRWSLYKRLRRHVRSSLGHPHALIEDCDIDVFLAQHIDDLLATVRELYVADVQKRRSVVPLPKPKPVHCGE